MTRVFIIDHHSTSQQHMVDMLQQHAEYVVTSAADSRDALPNIRDYAPDVLILNIDLPTTPGAAVLHDLRTQGITCPVIAYIPMLDDLPDLLEDAGFDAVLTHHNSAACMHAILAALL
jgi:DNA-binding NarL/FixJ family response regulator